jgi:transglutaminase-like putative cysteine protease
MVNIVNSQKKDPFVRTTVENILHYIPEKKWTEEVEKIYLYVKKKIRYTRDIANIEFIKTPVKHLTDIQERGLSWGDCDDHSILLATLLESAGYRAKFVIIRSPSNPINTFNHIFVKVFNPDKNDWVCLDPTAKDKPLYWCPPSVKSKEYLI